MSVTVWERASMQGYAQAIIPKDTLDRVQGWPVEKLHTLAEGQLAFGKRALEQASHVAWYQGLYVRWVNHTRWGPFVRQLADAESTLRTGEGSQKPEDQRKHYLASWMVSRNAAMEIAHEASLGETSFVYVLKDLTTQAAEAAKPVLDGAAKLGQGLSASVKWGVGIALALLILREARGK